LNVKLVVHIVTTGL